MSTAPSVDGTELTGGLFYFVVALPRHNTHHYLQFFKAIRAAIREGRFGDYKQRMIEYLHAGRYSTVGEMET